MMQKYTTGNMIIDLKAIRDNWKMLNEKSENAECGAVVKADAYGCGTKPIVKALRQEGCNTFFCAILAECIEVREVNKDIRIFCFAGMNEESKNCFLQYDIIPMLNSIDEIEIFGKLAKEKNEKLKCAIHIDTGMNRLGLNVKEWENVVSDKKMLEPLDVQLLMTHYACADVIDHPKTKLQNEIFDKATQLLPSAKRSAANSAGTLQSHCFDLTRPGIALYGGQAISDVENSMNPMKTVVTLYGKIIKIRECEKGEEIGYGGCEIANRKTRIAYVGVGYADGYPRASSNIGVPIREMVEPPYAFFDGEKVKGIGRVSMDMCGFDVTDIDENKIKVGDNIELIGENVELELVAKASGTIGYEVLTRLGHRCLRQYVGEENG